MDLLTQRIARVVEHLIDVTLARENIIVDRQHSETFYRDQYYALIDPKSDQPLPVDEVNMILRSRMRIGKNVWIKELTKEQVAGWADVLFLLARSKGLRIEHEIEHSVTYGGDKYEDIQRVFKSLWVDAIYRELQNQYTFGHPLAGASGAGASGAGASGSGSSGTGNTGGRA